MDDVRIRNYKYMDWRSINYINIRIIFSFTIHFCGTIKMNSKRKE
jgi:hypothetical protein